LTASQVALIGANDYEPAGISAAVEELFSLFGEQLGISRGDKVLLKPNFIAPKPRETAAITDPAIIVAVAKTVIDLGGKPFVADSPAWATAGKCVEVLRIDDELKRLGVPVVQMNNPVRIKIDSARIGISKVALDADKIINLPKFKAHQQLGATFAIKNMYGCVCGKEKAFWHMARGRSHDKFCKIVVGIYKLLDPALTIIDGITAMEGMGPLNGTPKHLGAIIAGVDPVACERVCAELMGIRPEDLPVMKMAEQMEMGTAEIDKIEIIGENIETLKCSDFQPAQQIPLHFSFPRVCKSVLKQLIIMTKALFKGKK